MIRFLKAIFVFLLPLLVYTILILIFKNEIFKHPKINYNRTYLNTEKLIQLNQKPTSFILGNSRSLAITSNEWKKYLAKDEIPFHFDGSRENIFQIRKKIEFLIDKKLKVNNLLIVLDYESINDFSNDGHIYQLHPDISNSFFNFHLNEIKPFYNIKFLSSLIIYFISNKYYDQMQGYILPEEGFEKGNYNDLIFKAENEIRSDSISYYLKAEKNNYFKIKENFSKLKDYKKLKSELNLINELCTSNSINTKLIIVSPYGIESLGDEILNVFYSIFSKNQIYDFSKDSYRFIKGNYYEFSHFRKHIGDEFLRKIYK